MALVECETGSPVPAGADMAWISSAMNVPRADDMEGKEMSPVTDRFNHPNNTVQQLGSKVDQLQKELEKERRSREEMQRMFVTPESHPPMGRPWLLEFDIWRPQMYDNGGSGDTYSEDRQRLLEGMGFDAMHGRKRAMVRAMEAELIWLKREDEAWMKLSTDAAEERKRTDQMRDRLLELQAQSAHQGTDKEPEDLPENDDTSSVADRTDDLSGPDRWPIPRLNRVEWKSFIRLARDYTLDVLEGEPSMAYVPYNNWGRKLSQPMDDNLSAAKKRQFAPGQGPMPERIRINSRHIIEILQKLDLKSFGDEQEPVIMGRPFKALVYLEDQIRQIHQALKEKHQAYSEAGQEPSKAQKDSSQGWEESQISERQDNISEQEAEHVEERQEELSPVAKVLEDPFTSSAVALEQWGVLVEFLDADLKMKLEWMRSDKCQKVAFSDIWYLFSPGDEVIEQRGRQAYRVIGVTSPSHKFISPYRNYRGGFQAADKSAVILYCVHIDFDGKNIGPVLRRFTIPRFDGEKAVTSLRVYPLRFAEGRLLEGHSQDTIRDKLVARGKLFVDVCSFQKHMHYGGLTLDSREQVDGQVVIDFEKALETNDRDQSKGAGGDSSDESNGEDELEEMAWRPKIDSLLGVDLEHQESSRCYEFCCAQQEVLNDQWAEVKRTEDYRNSLVPEERWREPSLAIEPRAKDSLSRSRSLGEEDYAIMSYRVFGFILRSRKWGKPSFHVTVLGLTDRYVAKLDLTHLSYIRRPRGEAQAGVQPQEMAFNQLVLKPGHKKMLLSLVAQHYRDKESPTAGNEQVDIVRGKGIPMSYSTCREIG